MKKAILIITGCIGVGLGAVGAVLPLLPAFPFLLLAAVCFAKSSERLDRWFRGTKLYKNDLESFAKGQGMTKRTKIKVMITVTLLMAVGFAVMFAREVYIPCMILGGVWLFHIIYFAFMVKTHRKEESAEE